MVLLEVKDLTKTFGGLTAIGDISFSIEKGEIIGIIGPNGAGKTTLFNLLTGFLRPDAGAIVFKGDEITGFKPHQIAKRGMARTFQITQSFPNLTVLENVTLPQELAGWDYHQSQKAAVELLGQVGLADRRDTFPDKLSGGEQQRVALARALVHNPMLVLADEPTGNLDQETGRRVLDLLLELTRRRGKTLIMATHNPDIARLADRVFRIHEGTITEERMGDREHHA